MPQTGDGAQGLGDVLGTQGASAFLLLPLIGAPSRMWGLWSLLLLWGLVTPCQGLLEKVGTLARIDKDELGKGEPRWAVCGGSSCSVDVALTCPGWLL